MGLNKKAAKDWVKEAHKARYKVEALARRLGITAVHLRRLIREHFKVRAGDYLRGLQINYAINCLEHGMAPKEVWRASGFRTLQHFSQAFKRMVGRNVRA